MPSAMPPAVFFLPGRCAVCRLNLIVANIPAPQYVAAGWLVFVA